jgi:hypothetical protein
VSWEEGKLLQVGHKSPEQVAAAHLEHVDYASTGTSEAVNAVHPEYVILQNKMFTVNNFFCYPLQLSNHISLCYISFKSFTAAGGS